MSLYLFKNCSKKWLNNYGPTGPTRPSWPGPNGLLDRSGSGQIRPDPTPLPHTLLVLSHSRARIPPSSPCPGRAAALSPGRLQPSPAPVRWIRTRHDVIYNPHQLDLIFVASLVRPQPENPSHCPGFPPSPATISSAARRWLTSPAFFNTYFHFNAL
jgi:hypothetical protein